MKGKHRVGIIAVLEPKFNSTAPVTELLARKFQIVPAAEAAVKIIQLCKARKTDLTVLLYHGYYDNAVGLAKNVPGIDVIVLGHEQRLLDLQMVNRTAIVSPGEQGNRIGILELSLSGGRTVFIKNRFRLFSHEGGPDDPQVRKMIDKYYAAMTENLEYNISPLSSATPAK